MVGKVWRTREQSKAFTIVELIIVIVVIAILAAVIIVGYSAVVGNANDKSVQADISKLADSLKLTSLDNDGVPAGGATSSNTGDPTQLSGVTFKPNTGVYDLTVSNLYYCSGTLNGANEFAVAARSKSGKAFSYISNKGVSNFTGYTWTTSQNGVAVCTALGFTAPFTWSYGYDPTPNYGWMAWAYTGAVLTNLVANPSIESNTTGWLKYTGVGTTMTRVTSGGWSGSSYLSAVGDNTTTAPRVYIDIPTSDGDVISLTFRAKSTGQAATSGVIAAKLIASGSEISTFSTQYPTWSPDSNGWSTETATFTVPAGGDHVRLSIGIRSATNYTGTMGIDAVMAVKSATVPTYADGNTPRWSWTGTTNNSTSTGPAL